MVSPQKCKNRAPILSSNFWHLPSIYKNMYSHLLNGYLHTCECTKKLWYKYTMEFYVFIKKDETIQIAATWKELENILFNEVSQRNTYYF